MSSKTASACIEKAVPVDAAVIAWPAVNGGAASQVARPQPGRPQTPSAAAARTLTFREQRELEALPAQIEALEAEQTALYARLADPALYQAGGEDVVEATARLAAVEQELPVLYARWEELEALADR